MVLKNQVFVPTVSVHAKDVATSMNVQKPLAGSGYMPGLMLVIRGGRSGVAEKALVEKQYSNIKTVAEDLDRQGSRSIVVMLSNMPIGEIDMLNNTQYAMEHVLAVVDFAKGLPVSPQTSRIVTFHLNSLVPCHEFNSRTKSAWEKTFYQSVMPALTEIGGYAAGNHVSVKVETTPVPEFGDLGYSDARTYGGMKLRDLRNPFYLTGAWGFNQVREAGLGICLDLCHARTIYNAAKLGDPEGVLHKGDAEILSKRVLYYDVADVCTNDIVHLNDGDGHFAITNGGTFREGIVLGNGDIKELGMIISSLNFRRIPFVIEVAETDFDNRPNTVASIGYLLG